MRRLLLSFSGGETSARMTEWCLQHLVQQYDEHVVVFANMGTEWDATLDFVRNCDERLGFATVWLEADVHHDQRKGSTSRVVNYGSASRHGEPFREIIRKYGIPNPDWLHCTREGKTKPIHHYCREVLGWGKEYDTAIGIRVDEMDRLTEYMPNRLIYPMAKHFPQTKPQINAHWRAKNWRLELKHYQGNCKFCYKKSLRKLLTIAEENPEAFDFPRQMEREFGCVGPEFKKSEPPAYSARTWFRGHKSVDDIMSALVVAQAEDFVRATDDAQVYDVNLDTEGACGGETCEPFAEANQ